MASLSGSLNSLCLGRRLLGERNFAVTCCSTLATLQVVTQPRTDPAPSPRIVQSQHKRRTKWPAQEARRDSVAETASGMIALSVTYRRFRSSTALLKLVACQDIRWQVVASKVLTTKLPSKLSPCSTIRFLPLWRTVEHTKCTCTLPKG